MKTWKSTVILATGLLVASASLAACSGNSDNASQTVTWYTDYDPEEASALIDEFTEQTGIRVEQYNGSSADVVSRLLSEHSQGVQSADAVTFAGVEGENQLTEANVLAELPTEVLDSLPEQDERFTDPDQQWFSMSAIVIAIAYNTQLVETGHEPTEYTDFLDPYWEGNFNIPVSTNSTSVISYYMMAQDEQLGHDFLTELGQNQPVIINKSGDQAGNIVRGEQIAGFFNDYVAWKQVASGAPITVTYPSDGVSAMHDYTALIDGAPNAEAATQWLQFLASVEAGQILSDTTGRYSTFLEVTSTPDERPEFSELTFLETPDTQELLDAQAEMAPFLAQAFNE